MTDIQFTVKMDKRKLNRVVRQIPAYMDKITREAAEMGVAIARGLFEDSPPDTSRPKIKRGGRTHFPSFPGNPPRIDTGKLYRSLKAVKKGSRAYTVLADDPKAATLEFGGKGIAPRPFMGRTSDILVSLYSKAIIKNEFERYIR